MSRTQRITLPLLSAAALLVLALPLQAQEVLATVNGSEITQQDYQRFVFESTQGVKGNPQLNPQDVLNEMLSRELVYQDAIKQGMDKREDIVKEVARLQYNLLVGVALQEAMKKSPVTEQELQALYDSRVKDQKPKEFKVRHILVKDKSLAEQIITELDLGGDFAKLAEKYSIHDGSKQQGGDIGWFKPQSEMPEFSRAVVQLEKGKYTSSPVQTPLGWHIIKQEDSKEVAPPTFEQIKPRLLQVLRQQKVDDYIQSLSEKAEVKVNQP